ncbi:hypothetical protein KOM00_07250 [Geomonas sp. Red69]|uniref:Uncharacterized protein n=1 Tax=Geomonas diazotrophica TaxID=2843197 RepID=A0ABX8JPE5_9BACT|nr:MULTISPECIES: hypothetical protein [Geomonas]MBU5636531.1 hypothetical protein [Geomonas diazotrophica]QWV98966.1 hypothetical protein KP005_06715 [Geomonas nitrogeniifigens]QXE88132.1 hypothetical protein KP003_06965 [Geomonas nitrogeniifigens]
MLRLKFDLAGRPTVFLGNCKRYYTGLCLLPLYQNVTDQGIALVRVKELIDDADKKYNAAVNYDRVAIVLRNKAFKELIDIFKKIAAYLQVVATEDDIPGLLQAGLEVVAPPPRKKKSPSASSN